MKNYFVCVCTILCSLDCLDMWLLSNPLDLLVLLKTAKISEVWCISSNISDLKSFFWNLSSQWLKEKSQISVKFKISNLRHFFLRFEVNLRSQKQFHPPAPTCIKVHPFSYFVIHIGVLWLSCWVLSVIRAITYIRNNASQLILDMANGQNTLNGRFMMCSYCWETSLKRISSEAVLTNNNLMSKACNRNDSQGG